MLLLACAILLEDSIHDFEHTQTWQSGTRVPAIGLGCMPMSQSYGPADEKESIATLHRAIEIGCNFFDTPQVYGPLTNEELLGRAFKDWRDQVVSAPNLDFTSRTESRSAPKQLADLSISVRP